MKSMLGASLFALVLGFACSRSGGDRPLLAASYEEAKAVAASSGRPIIVDFFTEN